MNRYLFLCLLFISASTIQACPEAGKESTLAVISVSTISQPQTSSITASIELFGRGFIDGLSVHGHYGNMTMCASGFRDLVEDIIEIVQDIMEGQWLKLIFPLINMLADGLTYMPSCVGSVTEIITIINKLIGYNWGNLLNHLLAQWYAVFPDAMSLIVRLIKDKPRLAGIELGDAFYSLFLES